MKKLKKIYWSNTQVAPGLTAAVTCLWNVYYTIANNINNNNTFQFQIKQSWHKGH